MITKGLIEIIYSAADIQRWNDHVRPQGFSELDKQAHKTIIAYVIARFQEEEAKDDIDWINLIEGGIFEFLHRVLLTDLKPSVFHELMEKKGEQLNDWVINELDKNITPLGKEFKSHFEQYLKDPAYAKREKRILKAAHYLATNWEFKIIYNLNKMMYGIEKTKKEIEDEISDYYDIEAVKKITVSKEYYGFLDICGQLGFQQRWAQLRMSPKTSVLGHMLLVAMLVYLCVLGRGLSKKRIYNNFYAALFHDLPEVLTRDIVNPVKNSIEGLDDIIREYEHTQVEEKLLPLLPESWHKQMRYFLYNEFENRIVIEDEIRKVEEIAEKYNDDKFLPIDGSFIEACDKFAAFVEACLSINYGIKSKFLDDARTRLPELYAKVEMRGLKMKELFDLFASTKP